MTYIEHWNPSVAKTFLTEVLTVHAPFSAEELNQIRSLGDFLSDFFAHVIFNSKELLEQFLELVELYFSALTKRVENHVYRQGGEKSSLRCLFFIVGKHMGKTKVPGEILSNGDWAVLDDRYTEITEKCGEIQEMMAYYEAFKTAGAEEKVLAAQNLMLELCDGIWNLKQALSTRAVFDELADHNQAGMVDLVLLLFTVAELKYSHRYVIQGRKNDGAEREYTEQQLEQYQVTLVQLCHLYQDLIPTFIVKLYNFTCEQIELQARPFFKDEASLQDFLLTHIYQFAAV